MVKHVPDVVGRIAITITNLDTGHSEQRVLAPDEYAIVYGAEWKLHSQHRVRLIGDIVLRLRRVR